ncbi:MAG: hypothetical protein ABI446_05575 [Gemmatimonadaceae bacterium]
MSKQPVSRAGIAATIAAALVVIAGLLTLGLPSHARERKLDGVRVADLSQLSSEVDEYWGKHAALPDSLEKMMASHQVDRVLKDPQTNAPYTYLVSGARSYRLCATFAQPSDTAARARFDVSMSASRSWRHGAGESCFDLTPPDKSTTSP